MIIKYMNFNGVAIGIDYFNKHTLATIWVCMLRFITNNWSKIEDTMPVNLQKQITNLCIQAKIASRALALASLEQKNNALVYMAEEIEQQKHYILQQNQKDLEFLQDKNLSKAMIDRLKLDESRIQSIINGLLEIARLPDPVGQVLYEISRPSGLYIQRVRVPLGVLAVIYESRPNVTVDAAALSLKSGNAVILRGGSESIYSSQALLKCLHKGLEKANLPIDAIQMVPTQNREAVNILIQQEQYIDVVIPRGGKSLITELTKNSKIPLFKHLEGLCHTYIHRDADIDKALRVAINAKMRRTGICGATETILLEKSLVDTLFPKLLEALQDLGCEVRVDENIHQFYPELVLASQADWSTEYLDRIISIKSVNDIYEAMTHISNYSSNHTDAIITENIVAADEFLNSVDSAIVMHNTSTQFADGNEFGMGAEIGISTGKLHARGPVGVEQLTTFKYKVISDGAIRSE